MTQLSSAPSAKSVASANHPLRTVLLTGYRQNAVLSNRYGRWFLVAWLAAMVDGKVFLAIAASTLTYRFLASGDRLPWEKLEPLYQQLFVRVSGLGRSPLLASTLAFATMYGFAAAWSQLGGSWAAITLLGLGAGNLLFFWREVNAHSSTGSVDLSAPTTAERLGASWDKLSSSEPLERLLAVRSLLHWCLSSEAGTTPYLPGTDVTVRSHLADCLRIMLIHETEPIVRSALIDGLKALHPKPQLPAGQPAMPPLRAKPQALQMPIAARVVEYVEPDSLP